VSSTAPRSGQQSGAASDGRAAASGAPAAEPALTLAELGERVAEGATDTVVVAMTDMQGRLVGKRVDGEFFLQEVARHGVEGCKYLLALDMENNPVEGYDLVNWEMGYGDFVLAPDLSTLRNIPWLDRTALVLCDAFSEAGESLEPSPRQVLARQCQRARALGLTPMVATELEFFLYKESYAEARERGYRDLHPTVPYVLDYHILASTFDEGLMGQVRRGMRGAGIPVEFSKGEAWPGQHEVNVRYADALVTADRHTVYKHGVKEIAYLNGVAATFMAKPFTDDLGSSCHVHLSLSDGSGANAFGFDQDLFRHCLGGMVAHARELALCLAPTINSYKRYAARTWAPTSISWAHDNRTCGFRVVGRGPSLRIECRLPGADMNPYLGVAALIAAGLDGIERQLDPGPPLQGDAYAARELEPFPRSLREALAAWEQSAFVPEALGEEVASHYANYARTEQEQFDRAVTDWERTRLFERG
jgi:glutamine synthetase